MFSKVLPLSGLICKTGREVEVNGLQANSAFSPSLTVRSVGSIAAVWPIEIKKEKIKATLHTLIYMPNYRLYTWLVPRDHMATYMYTAAALMGE